MQAIPGEQIPVPAVMGERFAALGTMEVGQRRRAPAEQTDEYGEADVDRLGRVMSPGDGEGGEEHDQPDQGGPEQQPSPVPVVLPWGWGAGHQAKVLRI